MSVCVRACARVRIHMYTCTYVRTHCSSCVTSTAIRPGWVRGMFSGIYFSTSAFFQLALLEELTTFSSFFWGVQCRVEFRLFSSVMSSTLLGHSFSFLQSVNRSFERKPSPRWVVRGFSKWESTECPVATYPSAVMKQSMKLTLHVVTNGVV